MIFLRHDEHLEYFLPSGGNVSLKLFVFTENNIQEFSLQQALDGRYSENYLLVFYKGDIDFSKHVAGILRDNVRGGTRIYWLDDFKDATISNASYIYLNKNIVKGFNELGIGNLSPNIQLVHRAVQGTISLDATKTKLTIQSAAGKFYELSANKFSAAVNEIVIPLTDTRAKVRNHIFDNKNGLGSLNFQAYRKGTSDLIQPVSPYFFNKQNTATPRSIPVFYFDKLHFNENTDTFVCLKPFKRVSNNQEAYSSFMESVFKTSIKTNFIDEKGRQYNNTNDKLVSRAVSIEYDTNNPGSKRFYFIPQGGESLKLYSTDNSSRLFAGFNGTETFNLPGKPELTLTFSEVENVSLNKIKGELEKNGDSKTSLVEIGKLSYCLDSERSPLFNNNELEPSYEFVNNGQLEKPVTIPIIPTLSFRGNEDLEELEEVFKKVRLKNITLRLNKKKLVLLPGGYITPQGFLKKNNSYDFINNTPGLNRKKLKNARGEFQFNITDNGKQLDLSLRKEEVFFVLTPGLYKEYKNAFLNARFSINKSSNIDELFELDLTTVFDQALPGEHDNSIIIFKFHKKSVNELLRDTTQWSNDGDILGNQQSLRNVVSEIDKKHLLEIDDTYFTDSILADRNWNGVVILNVPIGDANNLPTIFTGLADSQRLSKKVQNNKLKLDTELNFRYAAFPVNKTEINGSSVSISSTSFYGLIDYNPFEKGNDHDYKLISDYFDNKAWRFVLSKLKVRFANSKIVFFESFAFLQVHELFDDTIKFKEYILSNGDDNRTDKKPNLIRLKGSYQKNSDDRGQFLFAAELEGRIEFPAGSILKFIDIGKVGFSYDSGSKDYRFDIDASAKISDWKLQDLISIKKIDFSNIGLKFKLGGGEKPSIGFDLTNLFVLPDINFDCNGFLSSFPIKFSHFKGYKLKLIGDKEININYDFFTLPGIHFPSINIGDEIPFFSFVFDFDLGTLGNLSALKALKGQLLFGWSRNGGFALGIKINGSYDRGFHIDLFGALKLDIERVGICQFGNHFMLILDNARLKVLGVDMPSKDNTFNALMFAEKGNKLAWLISYVSAKDPNKLVLGIGQRVGLKDIQNIREVDTAITAIKKIFDPKLDPCLKNIPVVYAPDNNWTVGSDDFIPDEWKDIFDLKFIFIDPVLYGVFLRIVGLLDVEILYKKVSENLGVWSLEVALDPSLRNIEMGGAAVTLPNVGIDLYTNGDWRGDIGYPRSSNDWSRSCLIQIRPFVGWAGMYISRLRNASLSLFAEHQNELPAVNIIQAGFAFRIGLGAYINKGIFYVGASISVYGILEGAFAFNKTGKLQKLFPDHFALRGRVGAMAELIGYVDFKIIKASVYILLRVEFGFLLVLINGKLKPVPVYLEGEVRVDVSVTICCFRIFRKNFCIVIHLSFHTTVRFPYTLGDDSKKLLELKKQTAKLVNGPITVALGEIPIVYIPAITKTGENGNQLIHHFGINLFGYDIVKVEGKDTLKFPKTNILKDHIIKPIFEAVLNTGISHYSQLRDVFLEGPEGQNTTLTMKSYKPVLFAGYSDFNDRNFLKKNYLLSETEIDSFIALMNATNCDAEPEKCPFRLIPAPIVSTINVVSKNGTKFTTDERGFTIELTGLFVDSAGNADPKTKTIKRNAIYTDDEIQKIEEHFDECLTQFNDRSNAKNRSFAGTQDIREDAILQEYFKLIGLLTLESYFNFLCNNNKKNGTVDFDPVIKLSDLLSQSGEWVLNDHLEQIICQLNYFYNNGLRILNPKNSPNTRAYFEAVDQNNQIIALHNNPLPNNVDIKIKNSDASKEISLKEDMFYGNGLDEFMGASRKNLGIDFNKLLKEFKKVQTEKPYALLDVKLPVSNSFTSIDIGTSKIKFFNVPDKVRHYFKTEKTALELNVVDKDYNAKAVVFTPCINVEVKIKPHKVGDRTRVVELINVYIDDLSLMNKVRESKLLFKNINVYLKESKNDKVNLIPIIKSGEEAKTQIVRTNLSPRTHPPVILDNIRSKKLEDDSNNVANITEQEEFIRILWEALTTNNGGYYIVESPNSDLFGKMPDEVNGKKMEYTLVFNFESEEAKPFSAIHNLLKIADSDNLFDNLDKSTHSLVADVKRVNQKLRDKTVETLEPVREYHSRIPAHCFGFSVERTLPDVMLGHDQYLPLEFEIVGSKEITRDKILPLMPVERKDESTGKSITDRLFYSHITPLSKVTHISNENRYANVGKTFKLNFGIRDTYGFRAIDLNMNLEYPHVYFDKLLPLNSWPFIECSYWFKEYRNDEMVFTLNIRAFHNVEKIQVEEMKKIREALYTAIAQLTDVKVSVTMNYTTATNLKTEFLRYLKHVLANLERPKEISEDYLFRINTTPDFKMILDPVITIARPNDDKLYVKVDDNVWEKETIRYVETRIVASNPEEKLFRVSNIKKVIQKDTIRPLNETISKNKKCPYVLGLGNNYDGDKIMYLIRRDYVGAIKYPVAPLPKKKHYFGIIPYSNQLYSGSYKPLTGNSYEQKLADIDLDKGLNLILTRIDDLLSPTMIGKLNIKDSDGNLYSQKLVAAKKTLVETELKNKTDNIDFSVPAKSQEKLREEFRELILNKLGYFYSYDGFIDLDTKVAANILQQLSPYRLTISTGKNPAYNITSSKLDFRKDQPKWIILFDQVGWAKDIEFEFTPEVTHIETDIVRLSSAIESSSWIQLVEPIKMSDDISTKQVSVDEKWPSIRRVFPPKPLIKEHIAEQISHPGNLNWKEPLELGKWQYKLTLEDLYEDNDELELMIHIRDNTKLTVTNTQRDFPGFIAFWSSNFDNSTFKFTDFIDDLDKQMKLIPPDFAIKNTQEKNYKFKLKKSLSGSNPWSKHVPPDVPFNVEVTTDSEKKTVSIKLDDKGFDIFQVTNRIMAVKPEIKAMRNRRANNDRFVYVTDSVTPATWAMPHITFNTPILVDNSLSLQSVFKKIAEIKLPYKSTAKFLLNTAEIEKQRDGSVPVIPVMQMEFAKGRLPKVSPIDKLFDGIYKNGYPAVSVTVYNDESEENNLPLFNAATIFKALASKKRAPHTKKRKQKNKK